MKNQEEGRKEIGEGDRSKNQINHIKQQSSLEVIRSKYSPCKILQKVKNE